MAELAVAVADGVHVVLVELTAARVCEVTHVVRSPALGHFAGVVLGRRHVVEGVVGGLPVEDDHVAGAVVNGLRVRWSAGDWRESDERIGGSSTITGGDVKLHHMLGIDGCHAPQWPHSRLTD